MRGALCLGFLIPVVRILSDEKRFLPQAQKGVSFLGLLCLSKETLVNQIVATTSIVGEVNP